MPHHRLTKPKHQLRDNQEALRGTLVEEKNGKQQARCPTNVEIESNTVGASLQNHYLGLVKRSLDLISGHSRCKLLPVYSGRTYGSQGSAMSQTADEAAPAENLSPG